MTHKVGHLMKRCPKCLVLMKRGAFLFHRTKCPGHPPYPIVRAPMTPNAPASKSARKDETPTAELRKPRLQPSVQVDENQELRSLSLTAIPVEVFWVSGAMSFVLCAVAVAMQATFWAIGGAVLSVLAWVLFFIHARLERRQ
jgi:hypothetical protein